MHMHSICSEDGEYTPKELMSLCLQNGVRTAALADHNTTSGVPEAQKWAAVMGVTLIPAVELDCVFEGVGLHVLGYWVRPEHEGFRQNEQSVREQEVNAAGQRIKLVEQLGIHVNPFAILRLTNLGVVTGETIAEVALGDKENDGNPLLAPYRAGGSRSENALVNFYWDYCAQGKPAYVPIHYISLEEAVALIHAAGGIAVLAHPGNNIKEDASLLRGIAARGVSGVEAYSSYHTQLQTAFYREQALALGLVLTCGSDFHGKTKPSISVGCVNCGAMESDLLTELFKRRETAPCKA